MTVRITLHLPGLHAASYHAVTFSYDPLPSSLAQVLVGYPIAATLDVFSRRTRAKLRAALGRSNETVRFLHRLPEHFRAVAEPPPRLLRRTDRVWTILGPFLWGGAQYGAVLDAIPVGQRHHLVVIDPRKGAHGQRVALQAPLPTYVSLPGVPVPVLQDHQGRAMLEEEDVDGDETHEAQVESFLEGVVARYEDADTGEAPLFYRGAEHRYPSR